MFHRICVWLLLPYVIYEWNFDESDSKRYLELPFSIIDESD